MHEVTQIRKLSLWIFFIPLIAINLCLIISQNPELLENTFFKANRGLESRFIWRFKLESYDSKELLLIFQKMVEDQGWKLDKEAIVESWFQKYKD